MGFSQFKNPNKQNDEKEKKYEERDNWEDLNTHYRFHIMFDEF